jgi:hypothetical protein
MVGNGAGNVKRGCGKVERAGAFEGPFSRFAWFRRLFACFFRCFFSTVADHLPNSTPTLQAFNVGVLFLVLTILDGCGGQGSAEAEGSRRVGVAPAMGA